MNAIPSAPRRFALSSLAAFALCLSGGVIRADDAYSWTSNDGVTIRARLAGWDGARFILVRNGHDCRIPPSRLSAESAAKARRLLDLPGSGNAAAGPPAQASTALPARRDPGFSPARNHSAATEILRVSPPSPSVRTRAAALPRDRHSMPVYGFKEQVRLVRTTAYTCTESDHLIYGSRNALGTLLQFSDSIRSAAADWSLYPVGTMFRIKGLPHVYLVDDYGSALVGTGTIDLYQPDFASMRRWGCRKVEITIVKWGSLKRSADILSKRTHARHCRQMLAEVNRQREMLSPVASR